MKFKYLSSDFLASYNELFEELESKQSELDSLYSEKFSELLDREKLRIKMIAPQSFEIGEKVRISGTNRVGTVTGVEVEFKPEIDELDDFGRPYYGPGRYFPIKSANDEEIATAAGSFLSYSVECDSHELAKDWGVASITEFFYQEDLEKVE